uniref:28 kDa Metastriate family member n=1 Tax=Rhipicephalus zambeziensis TaxID=60191 RepID=A0A224Y3A8_9ACAR
MDSLRLILICVCCFYEAQATATRQIYTPKRGPKWQLWWEALRNDSVYTTYSPDVKVGEGVVLQAEVFYDPGFYNATSSFRTLQEQDNKNGNGGGDDYITKYFQQLFQKAQEYFNNRSIAINISVASVKKMDNLTEYYQYQGHIIDTNKTVDNVIKFGKSLSKPNYTIFYLFTWPPSKGNPSRLLDVIRQQRLHDLGVSEVATNGTFCSDETSAAFIRHRFGFHNYWSTVKATLFTFGTQHFIYLYKTDYDKMKDTFSRCTKPKDGDVEAPTPLTC